MSGRPSLLFLTQRLPYPPIKGEKIRPFQILKHLARDFTIDLGCLIDDPADEPFIPPVQALCRDIHVARIDRRAAKLRCLTGLLTGEALSVVFFRDHGLARWVRDVVARRKPVVIFVNSSNMAPYVLDLPRSGLRIVDLADVDSEKWRAYADAASFPMSWVYGREWRKVAALEDRIARECDLASFVSDAEARMLAARLPDCADRIRGVGSGVDYAYFDPSVVPEAPFPPGSPVFVFTGTMDYPPNVDAVSWFATGMLPLIRRTHPAARFFIVGNSPSPAVTALAATEGVFVTGRVPDVRPYLYHATAAVAPMRIARGIQNKVLEAMAMGRPTIVTSGALEGIDAEPGREVILADDTQSFAAACANLDPATATRIGAAARQRILADYSWTARLARFDDVLRPATGVAA